MRYFTTAGPIKPDQHYHIPPLERLEQTAAYLDRCGAEAGHLVIFDRNEARRWEEKIFHDHRRQGGVSIEIWEM